MAYRTTIILETDTLASAGVLATQVAVELGALHDSGVAPTHLVIEHFDLLGNTVAAEVRQVESSVRP